MARSRNIKPGFYANEDLAECSVWARFIFPGLWMLADREGRMEYRPKRIKGMILPFDSVDVEPLLNELEKFVFIASYTVDGSRYLQIVKFSEHQNPHHKEAPSTIPAPDGKLQSLGPNAGSMNQKPQALPSCNEHASGASPRQARDSTPVEGGVNRADSLIPDSLLKPLSTSLPKVDAVDEIFGYWQKRMASPKSILDDKRRKAIKSALKLGYTEKQLCQAIRGCSVSPHHMGTNERATKYNSIDLIFRNADKIDSFIAIDENPPAAPGTASEQGHDIWAGAL